MQSSRAVPDEDRTWLLGVTNLERSRIIMESAGRDGRVGLLNCLGVFLSAGGGDGGVWARIGVAQAGWGLD